MPIFKVFKKAITRAAFRDAGTNIREAWRMNQNQNPDANRNTSPLWEGIVGIYRILSVAGLSIIMVFITWFTLFHVDQVTDAIIALGNFGSLHHFVIFSLISILWAFFIWYWARVFYYIEYHKRTDVKDYEQAIIIHTPRVLGAAVLLLIGLAFLIQASQCQDGNQPNPIRNIGILLVICAFLFIVFINLRRKIFDIKPLDELHNSLQPTGGIVPVISLPGATKKILIGTTIIVIALLTALIIWPIELTVYLGDGVTVLISCLCIWLPLLYWVRYFSLKLGFPLFLPLAVMIFVFSFFNGNANVRLVNTPQDQGTYIGNYYEAWFDRMRPEAGNNTQRIPMVIVLSEGGGIRAAYWSAQLMARIQNDYPFFRDYLFCISGVSGGSFGATIFDTLLDYYDHHPAEAVDQRQSGKNVMQQKITDIAGKDFLSPTIACMLTRGIVQLLIPVPIESFDPAKVFEETWENTWRDNLKGDTTFSAPFLSLWPKNNPSTPAVIPPLFLNTTQVENGYPVYVSNLIISEPPYESAPNSKLPDLYLPRSFHNDILKKAPADVRFSTASLLSARFPYVSPAGMLTGKDGGNIGLVDGGYFDNTGANTAYQVLFKLAEQKKQSFGRQIIPVIVYIKNGMQTPDEKTSGHTMLYQLFAPIGTLMQGRDANTNNDFLKLKDLVNSYQGQVITYSLQDDNDDPTTIPLGWALSRKAQEDIDHQAQKIDIGELAKYLK
jgi:hypothetical protein